MDPRRSAQDVLRCDICETPVPPMYCDICYMLLCKACVGEHLSDFLKEHKIVAFEKRGSSAKCRNHSSKICELYCEQCDIPICVQCVSSTKHQGHTFVDMKKILEKQKSVLQRDLQELKKSIYPNYQEIAGLIPVQKASLIENSKKIATSINEHGEELHRQIDVIIKKLRSDLDEMDHKHLADLNKHENEIKQTIFEITRTIADLEILSKSDDIDLVSAYKSRNTELRRLPPKLIVTLPSFTPHKINKDHIYQQFGSLTLSSIKSEKHSNTIDTVRVVSSPPKRSFIDEPRIIKEIRTECGYGYSVACLTDEDIWVRGNSNILKLYNLQREFRQLTSIQTKSGKYSSDIAVTKSRDLLYTDGNDRTVNIVKNTEIQTVIRLQGWKPLGVCSTSSGDVLVVMFSSDVEKQSKVVRYFGSTEKQCIQFNDNKEALYSPGGNTKFITENRNLDICVSDWKAHAVVVVNQTGTFRFKYTGLPSIRKKSFDPYGITTDSQGHILIADKNNNRIHILDQDGQFLHFIHNCGLNSPQGLCVDTKDNLFVIEEKTCKVKKIQYYM